MSSIIAVLFLLGKSLAAFNIWRYRADTLTEDAIALHVYNLVIKMHACRVIISSEAFHMTVSKGLKQWDIFDVATFQCRALCKPHPVQASTCHRLSGCLLEPLRKLEALLPSVYFCGTDINCQC